MLTNKHFIVALIVAPILAIIAYFATDYAVSERPHSAVEGSSYPLVAKSNCRYQSGRCTLKNGDIELTLSATDIKGTMITFALESGLPLQGAKIALVNQDSAGTNTPNLNSAAAPLAMKAIDASQQQWQATLHASDLNNANLLIVAAIDDALYYGETETAFTAYSTSFSQSNMH